MGLKKVLLLKAEDSEERKQDGFKSPKENLSQGE
jgi:hypothetical protein